MLSSWVDARNLRGGKNYEQASAQADLLRLRMERYIERKGLNTTSFSREVGCPMSTLRSFLIGEKGVGSSACLPVLHYLERHDPTFAVWHAEQERERANQKQAAAAKKQALLDTTVVLQVVVPAGKKAGDTFVFESPLLSGKTYNLTVPKGGVAGAVVRYRFPKPTPKSPVVEEEKGDGGNCDPQDGAHIGTGAKHPAAGPPTGDPPSRAKKAKSDGSTTPTSSTSELI